MTSHLLLAAGNPLTDITTTFGVDWPKFLSQVFLFLVVAFLLKKFALGPVQKTLEERRDRIAKGLADAEKMSADLKNAQAKAQEILTQAGAQATKFIEDARAAGAAEREKARQQAVLDAQDILAKARSAGDAELARLKGELRQEFGRLVVQAAARSTGDILTGDQKSRLADDAVRQLAA